MGMFHGFIYCLGVMAFTYITVGFFLMIANEIARRNDEGGQR